MQNKTLHVTCITHRHWDIYLTFTASCKLDPLNGLAFVPRGLYVPECERINATSAGKLTVKPGDSRSQVLETVHLKWMENSNKDDGHVKSIRSDAILSALILIFRTNSDKYSRNTFANFPLFCMATFTVRDTKFIVLLRQSHDCSY
jgi:hypothetical protein